MSAEPSPETGRDGALRHPQPEGLEQSVTTAATPTTLEAVPRFQHGDCAARRPYHRLLRWPVGLSKWLFGALCGMSLALSFLIVGWAQRMAQREVLKTWWKRRRTAANKESFADFAAADGRTVEHAGWPNWFLGQHASDFDPQVVCSRSCRWKHRLFGSLIRNAKLGVQAAFNTAVLTLPGTLLWSFAWYAGWINSFHKGYENYAIGPSTFALGIALFIAAMFYVPMALARQASTGDWRAFYQFKFVWRLVRRQWLGTCRLALLALGLTVPVLILKTAPAFWPQLSESLLALSPAEQLTRVQRYFFLAALYGVPAFVYFRMVAARVYARAIADGVQSGAIAHDELADGEWQALHRLGLLEVQPQPARHWAWRAIRWLGTRTESFTAGVATFLVWLLFVVNVMTHEFIKFHVGGRGWWNQPLIQLPWFDYTPDALREAAKETR